MATPENNTQTLTAKFKSNCVVCGNTITPGTQIKYNKAQGSWHASCGQTEIPAGAEVIEIEGVFGDRFAAPQGNWKAGDVVLNPRVQYPKEKLIWACPQCGRQDWERLPAQAKCPDDGTNLTKTRTTFVPEDAPRYLYVLRAWQHYTPVYDDGCAGGETDYYATCRVATEEEAAPPIEAEQRKARAVEAREQLKSVAREIQETGERPAQAEHPQGEKIVLSKGHYQDNEYLVISADFIWRVRYNGRDGDDWSYNNLSDSVGDRVPYTPELAARIRQLQEVARG